MRLLKMMIVMVTLGLVLAAGPAVAQEKKPATPATPAATPAPVPQPFPEGARIAYIDLQFIASNSVEGKAATAKIQDFTKKAQAELAAKSKQMEDLRNKLLQGGTVLSDQARMQLEREIEKLGRELQFAQQDAQDEQNQLTANLQNEFQTRLNPVIDEVAKEKSLHMVFSIVDSGAIWANTGLDITSEVMKRLDAAGGKTPATAKE
jgi:outer membrane protein